LPGFDTLLDGYRRFRKQDWARQRARWAELAEGQKRSHWMWFIFPQIAGLGSSEVAKLYAIASLDEAAAYLAHEILGPRLRTCTGLVLSTKGRSVQRIFGPVDSQKFHSSMTLFAQVSPESCS